ncbi:MAG: DNA primase small subunit domain-containing protein [Candidatus Aenigmatarchaeota archaeon]
MNVETPSQRKIFDYYNNENVLKKIIKTTPNREISYAFKDGNYGSRPNTMEYPRDLLQLVRKGAVSFHGSVERWKNPMRISTGMKEEDMNSLRSGWDLIIDIDSALDLDAAKLAAKKVIKFIRKEGVKNYGIKFSGNRGFHISIPWKAFPRKVDFERTKNQFPRIPQAIMGYIRENIKDELMGKLIEMRGSVSSLVEDLGSQLHKLTPYAFVDVEKDWGQRHLFRLPYSINEKSWLVSLPIKEKEIDSFEKKDAKIENVKAENDFFKEVKDGEATTLLTNALDWEGRTKKDKSSNKKERRKIKSDKRIPKKRFPPCIKLILDGVTDGRKRSIFILINFLQTMNWSWEEIEEEIEKWNEKNNPPLKDNYINTQLNWAERQERDLLPPNCENRTFYKGFGVCKPDDKCKQGTDEIKIKNPVTYPFK